MYGRPDPVSDPAGGGRGGGGGSTSPAARIERWAKAHRVPLLVAGLAAAAAAALYARRRRRTGTGDPAVTVPEGGALTPPVYGAAGYYDSTATDLYNAITPQLEELRRAITAAGLVPGPAPSPGAPVGQSPAPGPAPAPPPTGAPPPDVVAALTPWDTWQAGQLLAGRVGTFGGVNARPGEVDWGVIARGTLPATATMQDVFYRSRVLQALNPALHREHPLYVPQDKLASLRRP